MEKPGYISSPNGQLFSVLHRPEKEPGLAVLLVSPHGDEKRAAYGTCVRLARMLCESGCAVLRFDFSGTGDSALESQQLTLSSMVADCRAAASALRNFVPGTRLALIGIRLGGSIAMTLSGELDAVRTVAVAPLIRGRDWLRQERGRRKLRRSMVRKEMAAMDIKPSAAADAPLPASVAEDLGGLPVGEEFIREMNSFDLNVQDVIHDRHQGSLIIQISPRKRPLPEVGRCAERFSAAVRCMHIEPFWQPLEPGAITALSGVLRRFLLEDPE